MAAPHLTGYEDLAPGAKAGRTGYEDLAPAPQRVTGYEDLAPSGRSAPARLATGFKLGLQGAASNMARQAELAGIDSAKGIADRMAPTEEPEGLAGKVGSAAGTVIGLAPEFMAAGLASTVATGTPIPGIIAAGAASGAAGAPEGERLKGAAIGGGTALLFGVGGRLLQAAPWAVRALAQGGAGAGVSAGIDVAEGRPVDTENALAQGMLFTGLGAAEPVFGAVAKARAVRLEQLRARNRASVGVPAAPPPGAEAGSQIPVSAARVDAALAPAVPAAAASALGPRPAPSNLEVGPDGKVRPKQAPAASEQGGQAVQGAVARAEDMIARVPWLSEAMVVKKVAAETGVPEADLWAGLKIQPPQPRGPSAPTTSIDPRAVPAREIPVERLSLSPEVPNFKGDALSDTGVVPGKELGGSYERLGTAPIVAWERLDGSLEVITGRHRFDLARRTGEPTIPTQVVREADGFTKAHAQRFDAESNIRDGQGSTLDYARFFRGAREGPSRIAKSDAEARGLLARAKGRSGWTVGNDATDDLYTLFASGRINEAQTVAIARAAPGEEGLQQVGMRYALEGRPADYISNMIQAARAAERERQAGGTLDLFGKDESTLRTAEAMAEAATAIQRGIRERISAVSGASRRPEAARELGVDVRDPQAVRAAIGALRAELGRWESWYSDPELVARTREGVAAGAKTPKPKPAGDPATAAAEPLPAPALATAERPVTATEPLASRVSEPTPPYEDPSNPFSATPEELAAESARVESNAPTGLGPRLTRPEAPQRPEPVGHPAVDEVLESLRSEEPLPPRAANLSLSAITSDADVQRALYATAEAEAGFPGSVHQVPTAETLRRAQTSGLSPDELALVARQAQTNPDAALRAGLLMRAGARDVLSAAQEAIRNPGDETRAQLALAISRLAAIQSTYSGLGNAAGRFLNVFGQLRRIGEEHEATMKIVERAGGPGNLDAIAEALGRLESPEQVVAAARDLVPSTRLGRAGHYLLRAGDWIKTAWINGLVSGPHTHSVTMASNIINGAMTEAELAGSMPIGMLRRALTRDKSERVTVREMHARLASPVLDTMDALKIAKSAFLSGESRYGDWALDQTLPGAKGGRLARWARNTITAPMRALVTESEFFRAASYARELRGLATRKALGMGPATPEEFAQRVQSILANPPEAIVESARQRALEVDAATKLRGNLASIETLVREIPGAFILVPFFRVSMNISRQILMRTPLGLAMKSVREDLAAGGARADLAISRMTLGSGVALTAFLLARQGKINGFGPTDPAKRKVWLAEGNLPYSARYGDQVIDFARLEPVGSLFGIAADYADVVEHASEMEQNQVVTALTLGVVRNLINKTFLTNLHEALNGIYDPARAGAGFVRNLAGSVVPNIVNEAGRITDPYLREARTVVDAIRARIPKIEALGIEGREALPVRRGPLGDPRISQPGSVGSRAGQALSPFYRSTISDDPVIGQMSELGMGVGNPAEKVDGTQMTAAERDRFLAQSGRYARGILDRTVRQDAFGRLPPDQRQDWIEKAIRKGREAARADLRLQRFRNRPSGTAAIQSLEGIEPSQSSIPPDVTGIIQ